MKPGKIKLSIIQGATFRKSLRWGQPSIAAVAISDIPPAAPALINTTTAHGLPSIPWPVVVKAARHGLGDQPLMAASAGDTGVTVPVSTLTATPFKGPGELQFHPPVDLTGYTARAHFRSSVGAAAVLLELTTENGGIEIHPEGLVTIVIGEEQTAAITWSAAVYDLELVDPVGAVTRLVEGDVTVSPEVTRP